jgi:uncharacterized protein (TIGR02453 family)
MRTEKTVGFQGFTQESITFLKNVHVHNSKPWFEKNRSVYETHLLGPLKELVEDLTSVILSVDPEFEVRPSINRTISTIYRDTRFSRDKSLFKDTMWLTFKRPNPEWKDAPAYYFEITPGFYRYGMGYYNASRASMDLFRKKVDEEPDAFLNAISFFRRRDNPFDLAGETYKRPLPCDHAPAIRRWYQMKTFYLVCKRKIDNLLYSPELPAALAFGFEMTKPLYRYLMTARTTPSPHRLLFK